ncbi:hypothetical protein QGN29_03735 [Temperatibacter marinus]|uniref:VOC domain-containing protein n=1 Tax=Temperatibacter marinus TaxID=1456591 RepID=A0AA52EDJ1_9PROT|nr:hypothetical protein [Temperatibacter marinus]WND03482.1 hypothetical protein QGN29_03735 [Temperatibacter marinus]
MKTLIALIFATILPFTVTAQHVTGGFHEVVAVVKNRAVWKEIFSQVGRWQVKEEGRVDQGWLDLWQLEGSASFTVLHNPGTKRGFLRLIEFDSFETDLIRPQDNAWDTGGIFDLNMRVSDLKTASDALKSFGFNAASEPLQFSFGPFVVKEWIPRGPDGIRFALIERMQPPLKGWPHMEGFSRIFNSTMIVSNMTEGLKFWQKFMGFKPYLEHRGASKKPGPNVLGLPHEMADKIVRDIAILHPQKINEGSIELLAFEGFEGKDFSQRTLGVRRGLSRYRFPVDDLKAFKAKALKLDIPILGQASALSLSSVGRVNVLLLKAPGGALVELYEKDQ